MELFTRDLGFVNYNELKDLSFVKFNGVTVYEAWRKLIASGVPPITLQKCKQANLVDYKIYGNSVQNGTSIESVGNKTNNLLNIPDITLVTGGVTIQSKDGVITVDGTFTNNYNAYFDVDLTLPAGTYTMATNNGNRRPYMHLRNGNTSIEQTVYADNGVKTFTLEEDTYIDRILLYFTGTTPPQTIKLMLNEGNKALEFERYGYKIPIKASGKNLIDINKIQNGYINSSGGISNNSSIDVTDFIYVEQGKTYTFSYEYDELKGTTSKTFGFYTDKDLNTWVKNVGYRPEAKEIQFTSTITGYVRICYYNNVYDLQLEEGNAQTDYEPYVEPVTTNIYLDNPLYENEYISYKEDNLPNIPMHKGTNIIEVDTTIPSSYMEVVYYGKGKLEKLEETDNIILNSILATDTETEKDITDTEINQILDEIIGG